MKTRNKFRLRTVLYNHLSLPHDLMTGDVPIGTDHVLLLGTGPNETGVEVLSPEAWIAHNQVPSQSQLLD